MDVVTKTMDEPYIVNMPSGRYMTYTAAMKELDKIPSEFFPSYIQEKIEKDYEIRTFYICGKTYSMAIFSQQDDQTKIDFRRYNTSCPNRYEPILLPENVRSKIDSLMNCLGLNTGSIDLIKSQNGEYVFLEVNPCGQFGMIENACNYPLHKIVAEELIKMDNNG